MSLGWVPPQTQLTSSLNPSQTHPNLTQPAQNPPQTHKTSSKQRPQSCSKIWLVMPDALFLVVDAAVFRLRSGF